jgi:hypothetical protein
MVEWDRVRHFKREEWVKNPDRVAPDVVYLMDEMRDAAGVPIVIHVAWDDDGHVAGSSHYGEVATGVDFHFEGWSLLEQWLFAERFPWSGIGIYPYWNNPGLHVDLRRLGRDHPHLGKRWWRDQRGRYLPIDRTLLAILLS